MLSVPLLDFIGVKTFNANLLYRRYSKSSLASKDISSAIINNAFAVYSRF